MNRLIYTSSLDRTRSVVHELVRVERAGPLHLVVTATGLELTVDGKGDVYLIAGGNERRTVPPEPWEVRTRHTHEFARKCGVGGVVS